MFENRDGEPYAKITAAVTKRLSKVTGKQNNQLNFITWSVRGRITEPRTNTKIT